MSAGPLLPPRIGLWIALLSIAVQALRLVIALLAADRLDMSPGASLEKSVREWVDGGEAWVGQCRVSRSPRYLLGMRLSVSLPDDLVAFAEKEAKRRRTTRSGFIGQLLGAERCATR